MSSLPSQVFIGGIPFSVEEVKPNELSEKGLMGEFHASKQQIIINSESGPDMKKTTLIHEILHAIIFMSGNTHMEESEQERLVASMETVVYRFLQENNLEWIKTQPQETKK